MMKKNIVFLVVMFSFTSSFSQTWIHPSHVAKHEGQVVNFVGFVTAAHLTNEKQPATLISIAGKNNSEAVRLVIRNIDKKNFKIAPELFYLEQYVQIKGKVEIHNGLPQIYLYNDKQIKIARETEEFEF